MKGPLVLAGWALTLAVAFFAGRSLAGDSGGAAVEDAEKSVQLERRVEELTRKLAEERNRKPRGEAVRERTKDGDDAPDPAGKTATAAETTPAAPAAAPSMAAFSMEGATTGPEVSKRLMAFVDAQLKRGPEGHAAILEALNTLWRNEKTMKDLFQDETSMSRELYPWVKFLVEREPQMLDLSEYVFRTMAEKPESFADTPNSNVLEIFTEGVGVLLPGAVPEERLARFRAYAVQMLETPDSKQPKALKGNRSEIEKLLARFWAAPLTPEQALAKLKGGDVPARELTRLLRLVPPDALALLDVTGMIVPLVRVGDNDVMRMIGSPPLDRLDVSRIDDAMLEAMNAGKVQPWILTNYLQRTGRKQWSDVRSFFERALGQSDTSAATALQALGGLPQNLRPDKAYVEDLLSRRAVPEATEKQLRAAFGINK